MSFIEMLVALAIVAIVLLVAGELLVRLSRQVERQALRSPSVGGGADHALDQLEHDVREAALMQAVEAPGGVRGLVLDMTDGERITWILQKSSLLRRREPLGGKPAEREMVGAVSLMAWSRRSDHLMDLRLRREGETLRQRTVLLRNVDRVVPPPEAP